MLAVLALTNDNLKAGYDTVTGYATVDENGANYFEENENGPHEYVVKIKDDSFYSDIINDLIK